VIEEMGGAKEYLINGGLKEREFDSIASIINPISVHFECQLPFVPS
jgi:hypothetical protein